MSDQEFNGRPFSLGIYLIIVFALTWPFQIAYVIWGKTQLLSYGLSSLSMIMVTVGTFIAGRYIFKDGLADAGWRWGKPAHYLAVIGFAALLWVVPTSAGFLLGSYSWPAGLVLSQVVLFFLLRFVATLIPAFGEEFGWRGYLLPRLAQSYSPRKAVLLQSFIWAKSQSLAVASVYHSAYDEIRDTMERTTGMVPITEVWTNLLIMTVGIILLLKADWKDLLANKTDRLGRFSRLL